MRAPLSSAGSRHHICILHSHGYKQVGGQPPEAEQEARGEDQPGAGPGSGGDGDPQPQVVS